jgi:hypothetical protein
MGPALESHLRRDVVVRLQDEQRLLADLETPEPIA